MSFAALLHLVEKSSLAELSRDRDDLLALVKVVDALFVGPMIEPSGLQDRYPNGFIRGLIDGDPAGFGLLFLFFASVRAAPEYKKGLDEFIILTKELFPDLDTLEAQLMELVRESSSAERCPSAYLVSRGLM